MKDDSELMNELFKTEGDLIISTGKHERLEKMIHAIRAEIITHHRRDKPKRGAWFTVELIEKILSGKYFGEDSEFKEKPDNEAQI